MVFFCEPDDASITLVFGIPEILPPTSVLPVVALLLAGEGKTGHGVELYAFASRQPCVSNPRLF